MSHSFNQAYDSQRSSVLKELIQRRILILDGAMGTSIQDMNLQASQFGGPDLEGCNENLSLTAPDVIQKIHFDFLEAGCDIIETNTFGGTPLVLAEYGLAKKAFEINRTSAMLARKVANQFSSPDKPRFVAGSMGPTTKAISVTGGITFPELSDNYYFQAKGLVEGGVDFLLLETCQDTRNIKAAVSGIQRLLDELRITIPIAVSGTIEPMGTMLAGQSIESLLTSLEHLDLLYIGLNCATGPEFMTDSLRSLSGLSKFPVACVPNAGLPDESGNYLETPEMMEAILLRFLEHGWVNLIGGCCGTRPDHIRKMVEVARRFPPRQTIKKLRSSLSGIDYLEITDDIRPVLVGERTNVIGSKKFKTLITEGKFEEASEVGRTQIKSGAQIVDICLANPDRDELADMDMFLKQAIKKIRTPLMIDSTDEKVIELALTYSQGKAIINSINLEDGEDRFAKVLPLTKKYGGAVVVGTIDDDPHQGMGIHRERKLQIATRSFALLTNKYGISASDIYWDPLVFPCGTGDEQYKGSALETIEGIRLIKAKFPGTKTVLGISNVSFGLPSLGREVLNSVFLYHCVQAGLDLAIVNSEKLERFASIPGNERELCENLLFNRGADPILAFSNYYRSKMQNSSGSIERNKSHLSLGLKERLAQYIIEGTKNGLIEDLDLALKDLKPLDIINGPLMNGMDEVGRLFNSNQLIVAEVLQSAEAMKAAVSHLEPFMDKTDAPLRGKMILATVKGDVHDIGKNLVEIILSNNGFQVVNLGIKVPPEMLIQAVRDHKPQMIGLSGLLVKSAQQMVLTAEDLSRSGIDIPVLVGGAALTSNFVDKQISKAYRGTVVYASDAMAGLDIAKKIIDPGQFESLKKELYSKRVNLETKATTTPTAPQNTNTPNLKIEPLKELPAPPDLERHILKNTPVDQIFKYINPLMLYGRHLGVHGKTVRLLEASRKDNYLRNTIQREDPKALQIWDTVEEVKQKYRDTEFLKPSAIYQFFQAQGRENTVELLSSKTRFRFPRQLKKDGLCLSDFVAPARDHICLFVVSVGHGIRILAESLKNQGEYLKSHILQALAIESAEAYAELLHAQLRRSWGFADPSEITMMELFQAKYRGKRYSLGYPACPNLEDQLLIWNLLSPQEIGVELTEGFMMDPESSVSAIVFHHPQATYFSVGQQDGAR